MSAWIQQWDDRYRQGEYAYGKAPNEYFKEHIDALKPGRLLLPAEGEGRNAVYAASLGWDVTAYDISTEGRTKALQLAAENGVSINYLLGSLEALSLEKEGFDAIGLIYAHVPAELKEAHYSSFGGYLKRGGLLIFEAFSKRHLPYRQQNPEVGGPRDLDSLFSVEELQAYFPDFDMHELLETEIALNEGLYHKGKGSVVRCVGHKRYQHLM